MKIIKNGIYKKENTVTCEKCNCEFQYFDSEIKIDYTSEDMSSFLGGYGTHKYIECPTCTHKITLDIDFIECEDLFSDIKKWFNKLRNKKSVTGGKQMNNKDLLKNGSGYNDPTAYKAIKRIEDDKTYKDYWYEFKKYLKQYRYEKTGTNKDGRYCVALSVTDLLNKMKEIEGKK